MAWFGGRWLTAVSILLLGLVTATEVNANSTPALVVDVESGAVLYETMGTAPWFPASLTKLMTTYVALSAVREGRITMNTPLMVSARAASMAPSKMGFRPGTLVTLDNALKMLMVKSPNDVAVTVAEGISGSVEAFADEMNTYAARLGLHESHFANPNGLPDPTHVSSARDMGMIARALLREFPEEHDLFGIGVLAFGGQLIRNHNGMLGRYPGIDGMKTGYTCSAGYNVVLSAQRNGRRLITVVLGAPSNATRSQRAASLFDRYFAGPSDAGDAQLASLPSTPGEPQDLRSTICGRGRANAIAEAEAEDTALPVASVAPTPWGFGDHSGAVERGGQAPATTGPNVMSMPRAVFTPVRVFIGPVNGWTGPIAHAKTMPAGTTDVATAPTPGTAKLETASVPASAEKGSTESPAPGPMALLGATSTAPATMAANAFVHKSKSLSLAIRTPRRTRGRLRQSVGTTPSIIVASKPDAEVTPKPELKTTAVPKAAKPKKRADGKSAATGKPAVQ